VTWSPENKFREAFRNLNWAWIERLFTIETTDIQRLEHPQDVIDNGGEIFFLLNGDNIAATITLSVDHGEYELSNMCVDNEYWERGLEHALVRIVIDWTKRLGIPGITVLSSSSLENTISVYKQHGFQVINQNSNSNHIRCDIVLRLCL
jgi:putative acetyltransferase